MMAAAWLTGALLLAQSQGIPFSAVARLGSFLVHRGDQHLFVAPFISEPPPFSPAEMALLSVGVVLSFGLFSRRFGPILQTILHSRKDAHLSIRPTHSRLWRFFWEVLCQAKVIAQRPIPGLAHAFIFWGFLAFALVSANHFAVGVNLGFLSPESALGSSYFYFAAAWAVLVAISIVGLFVRRFFIRPVWLGKDVSYESGFISLLIFVLMTTYLASFFVVASSGAIRIVWWAHTIALLIFLPLIPHTKHLHLVLSPLTVFLKRNGFSEIPPLNGEEDFGLVTGKDITQLVALQAYSCVECGRCTEHCPAATTGKALNPKEIILGMRDYLNEFGANAYSSLLQEDGTSNSLSMEAVFQCTTCGGCEFQCPVGIQHLPIIVGLRRGATNTGAWEDRYGTKLFLSLEKNGNALGLSIGERDKFIAKQAFPIFDGTQEYCLWLGCMGGYDPKGREIIADFARIMDFLGTSFGVLKKEKCTGDPARRLGNDLIFQNLAEHGLKALQEVKVQKIVAICPHCVRTISTDWKEFGVAPEIEHHSEFMARHKERLPKHSDSAGIVYHDPCYLGRYRDIYEEPREIVALAGRLVEAPRNHERSFCCGAGGGLAFLGEESGARVSHVRAKELADTGAQTIGTACPFCNTMFRDALSAVSEAPPTLYDIAQLTARNLPQVLSKE